MPGSAHSKDRKPPSESAAAGSLAAAVSALKEATETLTQVAATSPDVGSSAATPGEDERELYYHHLEKRGALVDVDEEVDLASLPPTVTHVRYPDGRVQRIGYT
jgi:hypothetical protein